MFDAGIDGLLAALPEIEGLDPDEVRRLLSAAFADIVSIRDLNAAAATTEHLVTLRRLATALELEAIFSGDFGSEATRACAFVAAEALELASDLSELLDAADDIQVRAIPSLQYACIESGALYLISGFDANAAVASRQVSAQAIAEGGLAESSAAARMAESARALFELRGPPVSANPGPPADLPTSMRIRWEVWRRIAAGIDDHLDWLLNGGDPQEASVRLTKLSARLDRAGVDAEASHLANLLGAACSATADRALRGLVGPAEGALNAYVAQRSVSRPLLWPAAAAYTRTVLAGDARHAVVAVPTGAGKSSVAELGIAATLDHGWALYLTPTNALAGQVTRDLSRQFASIEGVSIRSFLGGAEFTTLSDESVGDVHERQVLVMTPEKCSLALRQSPEAFANLGLLVMDECHLIGAQGARGVTAELTVSAVLERAPDVRVVMLSALLSNAEEFGAWLENATGGAAQVITDPWRPTRTLRAVLGIDLSRAEEPYREAEKFLEEKPKRKNKAFEAPVNLLASYQGAWKTLDARDYALIDAELTVELNAERRDAGKIVASRQGYVNQAAGRVTKQLADSGERVLTFLPANRHHSFSVARDLPDLLPNPKPQARLASIEALLDLADYELGVESVLRSLIKRGIAVHTSAMLRDEQRASELSFTDGQARAIFATSTLAQGLNLPATAVVIGGTKIGDSRGVPTKVEEERTRADLLNAIGRAGRAYVSARSIGVVIPEKWVPIEKGDSPEAARQSAPFLQFQDASTEVHSQIQALIRTALDDPEVQIGRLTEEELAAFTFLASDEPEEGRAVLRRSFGAFREGLNDGRALAVSETINQAGRVFVGEAGAPEWIVEASRVSGVSLPAMGSLLASLTVVDSRTAGTVDAWRSVLISTLRQVPPGLLAPLLPEQPFLSSQMEALVDPVARSSDEWKEAVDVLDETLGMWMGGASVDNMVGPALDKDAGNTGRGSGNPLPKLIGLTENGFGYGVARVAGGLAALFAVGNEAERDELPTLTAEERYALDLFPLAVRFGCDSPESLAWYRWGFRRRRVAHLLAGEIPPPEDLAPDDLSDWVTDARKGLMAGTFGDDLSGELNGLLAALRIADKA